MASYRYPNLEFNIAQKPLDEPLPNYKYARTNFINSGVDNYAQPPSQDPDMMSQLLNVMPITDGSIDRRYGYSLWANPTATPTIRMFDYQSDITGARQVILAANTFVRAQNDDGSNFNTALFTPSMGAGAPRETTSRSYAYFSNGTDFKKWNGASSGGVTAWGIDVKNVTTSGAVVGPNFSGTVTDEGSGGGSGSQGAAACGTCSDVSGGSLAIPWHASGGGGLAGTELAAIDSVTAVTPIVFNPGFSTGVSDFLYAQNFGFSIPSTATITGIQVDAYLTSTHHDQGTTDQSILLLNASSTPVGTDHADLVTLWPGSFTYKTWGNSADTWGAGLAYTDINSSNFGVAIQCSTGSSVVETAQVDYVQITVWYTISPTTSWANPNNVKADDGAVSTATADVTGTSILQTTNYSLSVSGTITGIKVEIKCNASGTCTIAPRLQKVSADYGATKNGTPSLGALGYLVFGGSNDLWGGTWAAADITPSSFGVAWNAFTTSGSQTINVDAVRITVYTAPGPMTLGAPSGTGITVNSGRVYTYVFQNSSTGHYTDIGTFTASTGPLANQGQPISGIPVHNDSQVDKVNILATADGGDETRLYLVAQLANGTTTYTDTMAEATLLAQPVLLSTDATGTEFGVTFNAPPPAGFLFPTKHRGRIYMVKGPTLVWSKSITDVTTDTSFIAGRWEEAFPPQNSLDISELAETVQGMLTDGINLYMGTEFKIRRLQGDAPFIDPPDVVHNEVGILNQDVWKICFMGGTPVGALWLTPDQRVIRSDFNTYSDVGTTVQATLNSINFTVAKQTAVASFYSLGPFDLYILAIPTGGSTVNNTLLVYNLQTGVWVTWTLTDTVSQLLFHIQVTGAPELVIATNTGKLYTLTPNAYLDRLNDTPVSYNALVQTSWLDLKDPTIRKALNMIEVLTSDTTMTVTVEGADNSQDFVAPDTVVANAPLVLGPRGMYTIFLAGSPSSQRYYRFTFTSPTAATNVLEGYDIDVAPWSRI